MIKQNMHIHSNYSWDSNMSLETITSILIEDGIYYAGITDHVEFDRQSVSDVIHNLKIRNEEIDKINSENSGKIKLLKAVEISSPHLYKSKVSELDALDLDYIMGSIHDINRDVSTSIKRKQATYSYYEEILKMIEAKQIDVVGHIDYINRYYGEDYSDSNQISKLFYKIYANNMIAEINTSAKRRLGNKQEFFPSVDKLKLYSKTNKKVIIGSDAHDGIELIGDNLSRAHYVAGSYNLKPVIFEKRKVKEIKPPTYS